MAVLADGRDCQFYSVFANRNGFVVECFAGKGATASD